MHNCIYQNLNDDDIKYESANIYDIFNKKVDSSNSPHELLLQKKNSYIDLTADGYSNPWSNPA